ncbi:MAG: hypothetical protein Q7V63_07065 [Gammaproteobacteria bacterium]|nr:hypothetical protein [Gammaproteobacteria bacterium]
MVAKEFIAVVLMVGLIKICHASSAPIIKDSNFQQQQAKANSLMAYPCLNSLSDDAPQTLKDNEGNDLHGYYLKIG